MTTQSPSRKKLLASLDQDVTKIQVETVNGATRWRTPKDLKDSDKIKMKADGTPSVMKGAPGRRKTVELPPTSTEAEAKQAKKESVMASDAVLKQARKDPESEKLIDHIIQAIAEESASLKFERTEAEREGKPSAQLSTLRVRALKTAAETLIAKKEKLTSKEIDLESPQFHRLFKFVVETFQTAMDDTGMAQEQSETVFAKFTKLMQGDWENEARNRMKRP